LENKTEGMFAKTFLLFYFATNQKRTTSTPEN
jgi:hypothetical protein